MFKFICIFLVAVSYSHAQQISTECFNKTGGLEEEVKNSDYCIVGKKAFRIDKKITGGTDSVDTYVDTVKAYYTATSKVKFVKLYNKQGYLDGNFMEFFPNGRLKERGTHKDGRKSSYIADFYPSGKKKGILQYFPDKGSVSEWYEMDFKIIHYWDSTGNQIVMDGNGHCNCSLVSGRTEIGKVVDGLRDSIWSEYSRDTLILMESYSMGKMIEGVRYNKGETFKYTKFESMPSHVDGLIGFAKGISKNLKYPTQARRMGIEGSVLVSFMILKDGSMSDVKVVKGIDKDCDLEAIRVMKLLKEWYPGRVRGKPIDYQIVMPVQFKLF